MGGRLFHGAPGVTRTRDLLVRSQTLYPTELRALAKATNPSTVTNRAKRMVEARYVTLCLLLWDPASRQIVMANAGALPP